MKDFNCILCKYRNDESKCMKAIIEDNHKCPSLSNIYYGKMIKYFPFNIIEMVRDKIGDYKTEKYYKSFNDDFTENEDMKLIWGIKSPYDFSSTNNANLLTMNDIDLIYLKDENKYILGVETALWFKDRQSEIEYLNDLKNEFTKFMNDNNYNTDVTLYYGDIYSVFSDGYNMNTHFNSIEEAYKMFCILVCGYSCIS